MALSIADIYTTSGFNLIEASTGIGKTFAYLYPSLLQAKKFDQKIIIATHTIALQEQLFYKDLPFLLELLNLDLNVVLVKGMNQYLCLEKFNKVKSDPNHFKTPYVMSVEEKLGSDIEGSFEDFSSFLTKDMWHKFSADSFSCLSHTCPSYKDCHFFKARKPLETASIIIVNHHLLLTDLAIKKSGKEQAILPSAHHLIVDEAHHLPEIAEELFSHEIVSSTLDAKFQVKHLEDQTETLAKALKRFHEDIAHVFITVELMDKIASVMEHFSTIFEMLEMRLNPQERFIVLSDSEPEVFFIFGEIEFSLKEIATGISSILKIAKELEIQDKYRSALFVLEKVKNEAEAMLDTLQIFKEFKKDKLFYFEKTSYNYSLNCHFIHASKDLAKLLSYHFLTSTFCSATLTFDEKFEAFKRACGIHQIDKPVQECVLHSDFDYKKAMLFAIPRDFPEPQEAGFEAKLQQFCIDIIEATEGGVFILFTSYDQLFKMAERIKNHPIASKINLLTQGTESKQKLLENFKSSNHSVLLGTDSFWEGVDVQGEALRCVIITKLPFRSPGDPLYQATANCLKNEKKDPFFEKALPEACIQFKQGIGRLIRSKNDYGCVICTDMRIINKNYGRFFLKMLPFCEKKLATSAEIIQNVKQKIDKHRLVKK
jgi:ATP-dependent DNA helicase DinG